MKRLLIIFISFIFISNLSAQTFEKINITSNFEYSTVVKTIDFDGDGLDDFLAMGLYKLYWYENLGNGSFERQSLLDSLEGFRRFSLADWEGDGDMDIFFTIYHYSLSSTAVAWLENDGNQNFTYHLITDTISQPFEVKACDIDKDADMDILVSNTNNDILYWLKNDGSSNFSVDTIGYKVNDFEIADLDGDNDWDIIFAPPYDGILSTSVKACQNDGSNNFSTITLKSGFAIIHELIVEDVNGDGYFDIVVPDYYNDKIVWLRNDSTYDFSNFSNQFDIITGFDAPEALCLYDINEDGRKDLLSGSYNAKEIYLFTGTGTVSSFAFSAGSLINNELNTISDIAAGNFDNQNHNDFVHVDRGNAELSTWINDGSENFTKDTLSYYFPSPKAFDMQDLDGDGDQDVAAVSNGGDMVVWFENLGNEEFKTHSLISNFEEPYCVKINDLDDDGDYDIIAASDDDDKMIWWKNDGSGNFTQIDISTNLNGPRDFWIEDFDQDGDKDIAVICYWLFTQSGNTGAQWLVNDGNENFTLYEIDEDIRAGRSMRGADMNNNNYVDIVISTYYYTNSKLRIAVNYGSAFNVIDIDDVQCEDFEISDFDGDGDNDIIAVDFSLDSLYFYENTGSFQFTKHTLAYIYRLSGVEPVDFDGDGDIDIVFSIGYNGFTNGSIYGWGIFWNDGTGNLTTEYWGQNLSNIKPMEVFDYENDGDYDIMLGFDYINKIELNKNLTINCPLSVTVTPNGPLSFCEGDSVILQATSPDTGISFQWYNDTIALLNDTNATLTVDTSGMYYVSISDSSCSSYSSIFPIIAHPAILDEQFISLCEGETLLVDTTLIDTAGDYTFYFQSQWGCDSTVLKHISILDTSFTYLNEDICSSESYNFNGTPISAAGTYYDTLMNNNNCDSIIQLDLAVNPEYFIQLNDSICDGSSYNFNGTPLSVAGTYYDSLTSINGCDSIYELTLTVNPTYLIQQTDTICDGGSYNWQGNNYDTTGVYTATYFSLNGCDSIHELSLLVSPTYFFQEKDTICDGGNYNWQGSNYATAGVYTATYYTQNGCDSIYELDLALMPVYSFNTIDTICQGDSLEWRNNWYYNTSIYTDSFQTVNGCDSIYSLDLTANPLPLIYTVNGGGSYPSGGSGVAIGLSGSELGIDYTLFLNGTINISVESGTGSAISFGNQTLAGVYSVIAENTTTNCSVEMLDSATITITTGINGYSEDGIFIYPNPTSNSFIIEAEFIKSVVISNTEGMLIMEKEINSTSAKIDLANYAKAIYFIKIQTSKGIFVRKIILN